MRTTYAVATMLLTVLAGAGGCGGDEPDAADDGARRTTTTTTAPASPTTSETVAAGVSPLEDGPLLPGRYSYVLEFQCEKGDVIGCPPGVPVPDPLKYKITVPDGWEAATNFRLLYPSGLGGLTDEGGATTAPDGAGLVIGWTSFAVGLNSDPCARNHDGHLIPDIEVGPTVDDFVRAVADHPGLDVSRAKDLGLGGYRGRLFTLTGPSDISKCDDWRPWDPGFYVQGPDNHWDVYVLNIEGTRLVVVAQYFPGTSEEIVDDLHDMVHSLTFSPVSQSSGS